MPPKLVIDKREHAVLSLGALPDAKPEQLEIGDFAIVDDDDGHVIMAIERKTLADLSASIKDGRYMEQKCRALSVLGVGKYAYICEVGDAFRWSPGDGCTGDALTGHKQVRSAIMGTMVREGVPVFFSRDVADTCALVRALFDKVVEKGEGYVRGASSAVADSAVYKACFKRRGDNAKDPRTVAELQLSQIPGVSVNNAAAVMDAFGARTLPALLGALRSDPAARKNLLAVSGVGKKKADALMAYLCDA